MELKDINLEKHIKEVYSWFLDGDEYVVESIKEMRPLSYFLEKCKDFLDKCFYVLTEEDYYDFAADYGEDNYIRKSDIGDYVYDCDKEVYLSYETLSDYYYFSLSYEGWEKTSCKCDESDFEEFDEIFCMGLFISIYEELKNKN